MPASLADEVDRMTVCGTKRTSGTGLTMSVPEGKADLPIAYPDFSLGPGADMDAHLRCG
jgi:hypothetical protein